MLAFTVPSELIATKKKRAHFQFYDHFFNGTPLKTVSVVDMASFALDDLSNLFRHGFHQFFTHFSDFFSLVPYRNYSLSHLGVVVVQSYFCSSF